MVDAALWVFAGLLLALCIRKREEAQDETPDTTSVTTPATATPGDQLPPDQWPACAAALAYAVMNFPAGSLARAGAVQQFQAAVGLPITGLFTADVRDRCLASLQVLDPSLTSSDLPTPEISVQG